MAKNSKSKMPKKAPSDRMDLEEDPGAEARSKLVHWLEEIKRAKKAFEDWHKRVRAIIKLYKDERPETSSASHRHRMNILWSNINVLQPALYSKTPEANVSRRFLDKDPVSRTASLIVERNLHMAVELFDFDYPMKRARDDYLLAGRGTAWVSFEPEMGMLPQKEPVTKIYDDANGGLYKDQRGNRVDVAKIKSDEEIGEYYETEPMPTVLAYGLGVEHVVWCDFLHEPLNDWTKVGWVAKRIMMRRKQLIDLVGEKLGRTINLNRVYDRPDGEDSLGLSKREQPDCVEVWEIWCKTAKKVIWITDAYQEGVLKEVDDPLNLRQFFPCPRPIWATLSTDSLIPVPDYALYQDQADQIDELTNRIRLLTKALRVVGVFNAASVGVQTLLEEGQENEMIPIDNWVWFSGTGGLKGNVDWLPIEQISAVLESLFMARKQLREDLYEVTGISDIIRGATSASETATAQQLKTNFSNLRLQDRQAEMSRFARDTLRLMAEIQCEHYPEEVLMEMSGVLESDEIRNSNPDDQNAAIRKVADAITLIKQDKLRTFKIDIETDATVAADQQKEQAARVEFLTAVAPFLDKAVQAGQAAPQMVPLLMKMLDFGVRGFRAGRTLESAIEQVIDMVEKMQQEAEKNPQPEQPDPETMKVQGELAHKKQQLDNELQRAQNEHTARMEEMKLRMDEVKARRDEAMAKIDNEKRRLEIEIDERTRKLDAEIELIHADIALKEAQTKKLEEEAAAVGVTTAVGIAGPDPQPEDPTAESTVKATLAKNSTDLLEQQIRYAELVRRRKALKGVGSAIGGDGGEGGEGSPAPKTKKHEFVTDPTSGELVGLKSESEEEELPDDFPTDLGSKNFGKPKKKRKFHQILRDPNTGNAIGLTTDEIEVGDDDVPEMPGAAPTPVAPQMPEPVMPSADPLAGAPPVDGNINNTALGVPLKPMGE